MADNKLPEENKLLSEFKQFLIDTQQSSRPNPLQALGAGMAGFAAPFLGQTWTDPNKQTQGAGGDMMNMFMMSKLLGGMGGVPGELPPGGGQPINNLMDTTGSFLPGQSQGVLPGMEQYTGALQEPRLDPRFGKYGKEILGEPGLAAKAELDIAKSLKQQALEIPLGAFKVTADEAARVQAGTEKSALTAQYNFNLIGEVISDYTDVLVDSWEQGGAGNWIKYKLTELASRGVPIGDARRYAASGSISGKHFELVAKSFPMLTQQIGKEGSVRLIERVFHGLGQSYPRGETPPEMSPRMLRESIKTHYRINRAIATLNVDDFKLDTEEGLDRFAKRLTTETDKIKLNDKEISDLNKFQDKVLGRMDKHVRKINLRKEAKKRGLIQ